MDAGRLDPSSLRRRAVGEVNPNTFLGAALGNRPSRQSSLPTSFTSLLLTDRHGDRDNGLVVKNNATDHARAPSYQFLLC